MHVPMRTCVGCRHVRPQAELLRTRLEAGTPVPALRPIVAVLAAPGVPSGRKTGRSAYLCPSRSCLIQAARRGGFARTFQAGPVTADVDTLWAALSESVNRESDLMRRSGPGRVHRLQSLAAALNASGRGA